MRRILPFLVATGLASTAYGWGDVGHRITGHIANDLLSPQTKEKLKELTGTDDLAELATWMDDERDAIAARSPAAARWHYENRPVCGQGVAACPGDHCITAQLKKHLAVLANNQATRERRGEALRVVVHLIGDIHQPLHLADNRDRGGNDTYVRLPNQVEARRLHEVWDSAIVRVSSQGRSSKRQAAQLQRKFATRFAEWRNDQIDTWALESLALGKRYAYQALPDFTCSITKRRQRDVLLSAAYLDAASEVVDEQLSKAGARMAYAIEMALNDRPAR